MRKNNKQISLLVLSWGFLMLLVSCGSNGEAADEKSVRDERKIMETGELAAVNTRSFVMPRVGRYWYEMRVIGILEHGTIVEPGDSIIQLDPTEINKYILDREVNLENQMVALEKMLVDHDNQINEQEANLKNEEASFNLKKVELEASVFETERLRKIKQLEFEQAKITLNKAKRRMEHSKVIRANDLKIQKIRVQQVETEIKDAYEILPNLTLRTPISGVFQIAHNRRTNGMVKVGDNIYQGNNLGNVPELKQMKVITHVNETDFLRISIGQQVNVRLDALPRIVFEGEVSHIGKLCRKKDNNSRQKIFDVEVLMKHHDERLKPGMTVSCEYIEKD